MTGNWHNFPRPIYTYFSPFSFHLLRTAENRAVFWENKDLLWVWEWLSCRYLIVSGVEREGGSVHWTSSNVLAVACISARMASSNSPPSCLSTISIGPGGRWIIALKTSADERDEDDIGEDSTEGEEYGREFNGSERWLEKGEERRRLRRSIEREMEWRGNYPINRKCSNNEEINGMMRRGEEKRKIEKIELKV